jgi:hypothetical protein
LQQSLYTSSVPFYSATSYEKSWRYTVKMPIKGYNVVTIPDEIYEILKRLSAERGMSMSRIASEAIRRFAGEEGDEHSEQDR